MVNFTLEQQIEFMRSLELISSEAIEHGIPVSNWTGEDTLKISKIRKQLERIKKGGRPKKFKSGAERYAFHNANKKKAKK